MRASSVDEVRGLAEQIRAQTDRLDVLINNAGVGIDRRQETVDGLELTFAVNHLAPFVLTTELLDLLEASAPARVITVSSANHIGAKTLDLEDLQSWKRFAWQDLYARSKLCNVIFTRELARRLAGTGVTANCLHPGVIATEFGAGGDLRGLNAWMFRVLKWFLPGPERGARTSVYLASSPEVTETPGQYFAGCKPKEPSRLATDDELGAAPWRESERLVESVPRSPSGCSTNRASRTSSAADAAVPPNGNPALNEYLVPAIPPPKNSVLGTTTIGSAPFRTNIVKDPSAPRANVSRCPRRCALIPASSYEHPQGRVRSEFFGGLPAWIALVIAACSAAPSPTSGVPAPSTAGSSPARSTAVISDRRPDGLRRHENLDNRERADPTTHPLSKKLKRFSRRCFGKSSQDGAAHAVPLP